MPSPGFFYGKLPEFVDFVGQAWDDAYDKTPPYRFVFSPENLGGFLVGVLQPSRDKSDRKYPFCVALKKEKRTLKATSLPLIPLMFAPFFEELQMIVQLGIQGALPSRLAERIEGMGAIFEENVEKSQETFQEYLARTPQQQFWSDLFGEVHDPRKFLIAQNLTEIFQSDSPGAIRSPKVCLRFPLSGQGDSSAQEVCFWTHLCSRLIGDDSFCPPLFWKAGGTKGKDFLFVFLGKVQPKSFIQMVNPDDENDSVCKMDEDGKEKLTHLDLVVPTGYRAILARAELTLADVLGQIGHAPSQEGRGGRI
jgi:type VI secretion system ImpM family protein